MLDEIRAAAGKLKKGAPRGVTELVEGGQRVISCDRGDQVKTLDQLVQKAGVDRAEWDVSKYVANVWNCFSSVDGMQDLWQVKAWLTRKLMTPKNVADIIAEGLSNSPKPKPKAKKESAGQTKAGKGTMVEIAVPDLHLGKLCWPDETGGPAWDTERAVAAFKAAIEDLIAKAPVAEEAWFVLGNDFFNVDNDQNTTNAGTAQDEDGRFQRSFVAGKSLAIWSIERLREAFPKVRVIMVYGNHDFQRSFYLGEVIAELYKNTAGVEVDNRPPYRKYYEWGNTLIGFTHGDRIKHISLAAMAQNEARAIWGRTSKCEFHLGHLHHDAVKEISGVKIRVLPSLCPPDAWHTKGGYTTSERAASAFVYNQKGLQSIIYHYPEE